MYLMTHWAVRSARGKIEPRQAFHYGRDVQTEKNRSAAWIMAASMSDRIYV
jgi:hypothetical protein